MAKTHRKAVSKRLYSPKAEKKISKVMREFDKGKLHSGSKKGPVVKSVKQAQAIAISEARKRGFKAGRTKNKK